MSSLSPRGMEPHSQSVPSVELCYESSQPGTEDAINPSSLAWQRDCRRGFPSCATLAKLIPGQPASGARGRDRLMLQPCQNQQSCCLLCASSPAAASPLLSRALCSHLSGALNSATTDNSIGRNICLGIVLPFRLPPPRRGDIFHASCLLSLIS